MAGPATTELSSQTCFGNADNSITGLDRQQILLLFSSITLPRLDLKVV